MKAIIPHQFFIYASNFTLKSMLKQVALHAFDVFNDYQNSDFGHFAKYKNYIVIIEKKTIKNRLLLAQTWLIDIMYELACLKNTGTRDISENEALHLIALFNDYSDKRDLEHIKTGKNVFLNLYGFFGEQKRLQSIHLLDDEFSREKYILDVISAKKHALNTYGINVSQEFKNETGYTTSEFSSMLYFIYTNLALVTPFFKRENLKTKSAEHSYIASHIMSVIDKYTCSLEEVCKSPFKRQIFYSKPIIKIEDDYISVNPLLMFCLFVNSNYWVMRNMYKDKKNNSSHFINAFGTYFEMYVEEILENCLNKSEYLRIPEEREKRADWQLTLNGIDFLIEQKSGLSLLGIKQSQPDIKMMKNHILKNWGEAVEQLHCTQKAKNLINPIKIILVYEDYYKSECLDELFELNRSLSNDKKYWLLTIREFEMLLMTYKNNPLLFEKIVAEKDSAELNTSHQGRELIQFLNNNGVKDNDYLNLFGITNQIEEIRNNTRKIIQRAMFFKTNNDSN